jgi:N-acetylneuraminic acid mutarotase
MINSIIFLGIALLSAGVLSAQNVWTQLNNAPFAARAFGVTFSLDTDGDSIPDKGYYGGGWDEVNVAFNDFWEYDPATDNWTRKADIPGLGTRQTMGFGLGSKGYVGSGAVGFPCTFTKELYEYDALTDSWTQKNDLPGQARWGALSIVMNGKAYFGFGSTSSLSGMGYQNDFWEYNADQDVWTQLQTCACTGRIEAEGFAIDTDNNGTEDKAYILAGFTNSGRSAQTWEYDRTLNQWIQRADLPGIVRDAPIAFSISGVGFAGSGAAAGGGATDMYSYNAVNDTWTTLSDFPGAGRIGSQNFVLNNIGYVIGGYDPNAVNEVYQYVPLTSVKEHNKESILNIYPNPGVDQFYLLFSGAGDETFDLKLFDLHGKEIVRQIIETVEKDMIIPFNPGKLPHGMYLLTLTGKSATGTVRLVITD